jgi:hypothetical protein
MGPVNILTYTAIARHYSPTILLREYIIQLQNQSNNMGGPRWSCAATIIRLDTITFSTVVGRHKIMIEKNQIYFNPKNNIFGRRAFRCISETPGSWLQNKPFGASLKL